MEGPREARELTGHARARRIDEPDQAHLEAKSARMLALNLTVAEWNTLILARLPRNGDREAAHEVYPWLRERSDLILALDVREEDDRLHFARRN